MNGKPLPADHGYPLRAVAPGIVGARNVKWLGKIVASDKESDSHWQQKDYKVSPNAVRQVYAANADERWCVLQGFNASVDWDTVDFSKMPAIQEMPVQSAISSPGPTARIDRSQSELTVKGFAWSGGGRAIIRVDVSLDGGKTWHDAELRPAANQARNHVWAWTLWEATVPLPESAKSSDQIEICCKAVDSQYNNQPERAEPIWNLRGVLNNSWHKIQVPLTKE
mmetsp:Transcript_6570/g.13260  ORF Transcript_6570/g.13260 Transcript_6570/m.13260 type:complete len:224 (+) Transcript_6570:1657-2328(+)